MIIDKCYQGNMEYGVTCVRTDLNNFRVYFVKPGNIYRFDLHGRIQREGGGGGGQWDPPPPPEKS